MGPPGDPFRTGCGTHACKTFTIISAGIWKIVFKDLDGTISVGRARIREIEFKMTHIQHHMRILKNYNIWLVEKAHRLVHSLKARTREGGG